MPRLRLIRDDSGAWASASKGRRLLGLFIGLLFAAPMLFLIGVLAVFLAGRP